MGDDVQDVVEAQKIEGTLRRAIEVVSHLVWEHQWDGMFRRDELIEELEELAKRPRDILAAREDGRAARKETARLSQQLNNELELLREQDRKLDDLGDELRACQDDLDRARRAAKRWEDMCEEAQAEIARLKADKGEDNARQ